MVSKVTVLVFALNRGVDPRGVYALHTPHKYSPIAPQYLIVCLKKKKRKAVISQVKKNHKFQMGVQCDSMFLSSFTSPVRHVT